MCLVWRSCRFTNPAFRILRQRVGSNRCRGLWDSGLPWNRSCTDVYIFVRTPDGFQPTTDMVVNGCSAEFGFARSPACPKRAIRTPSDLVAHERKMQVLTNLAWVLVGSIVIVLYCRCSAFPQTTRRFATPVVRQIHFRHWREIGSSLQMGSRWFATAVLTMTACTRERRLP